MPSLHKKILTVEQTKLLPLVGQFSKDFGLVGGTAIALHLGHRRSIDFDLFSKEKFGNLGLLNKILSRWETDEVIVNKLDELTLTIKGVKFTFFRYPFAIEYAENFGGIIKIPDLLTLGAMKAFALGQRSKWKDYVDLYFIIKDHLSVSQISGKAKQLFAGNFNEKLFRGQLAYFEGVSYAEQVDFMPGFKVDDKTVKKKLIEFSLK